MPTTNLGLEELLLSDKLKTEFVQKINGNMQKLDTKYNELKQLLLDRTQQDTLQSAISLIEQMYNTSDATAISEEIKSGKVAYSKNGRIVGAMKEPQNKTATVISNDTSVSFTFDFYPTMFFAFRKSADLSVYYTRYELVYWDGINDVGCTCYSTGRTYYSYMSTGGTKTITDNGDGTYTVTLTYNGTNQYIAAGEWQGLAIP